MNAGRAEAAFWAAFLHNRNVDASTASDGAVAVAGGYALFVAGSLIDHCLGAGTTRPLRDDDCEVVESFYRGRGTAAGFELDAEVLDRDAPLLRERGYTDEGTTFVVLEGPVGNGAVHNGVATRTTTDRHAWIELIARAFGYGDDPLLRRTLQTTAAAAGALVVASVDGVDAGAAALGVSRDTAILYSAGVLPEFRRRGVHGALLAARIEQAAARGASHAVIKTEAGSDAERSALRHGFARTTLRRRLRREVASG
ncbi:MAG TPA: GNAT family N-acetyltransferase [Candidatus Elarobacter sp.]|jgi:GNAT superfamily N-acetyltransferase|nr:GNAT family N-acetyltransferase [Candidatus Elarobacter sp.]